MDVIVWSSLRRVAMSLIVVGLLFAALMVLQFVQESETRPDGDEHDIMYRATGVIESIAGADNEERFTVRITDDAVGHFGENLVCFLYPQRRWPPLTRFTAGEEVYID